VRWARKRYHKTPGSAPDTLAVQVITAPSGAGDGAEGASDTDIALPVDGVVAATVSKTSAMKDWAHTLGLSTFRSTSACLNCSMICLPEWGISWKDWLISRNCYSDGENYRRPALSKGSLNILLNLPACWTGGSAGVARGSGFGARCNIIAQSKAGWRARQLSFRRRESERGAEHSAESLVAADFVTPLVLPY
jgi:hypothetical protein